MLAQRILCIALTKNQNACKNIQLSDSEYCKAHDPHEIEKRAEERLRRQEDRVRQEIYEYRAAAACREAGLTLEMIDAGLIEHIINDYATRHGLSTPKRRKELINGILEKMRNTIKET